MKKSKKMTTADAIFLLVAGLIMGTVFTFGMQYWNAPVTQEEAIHTTAIYESYATQRERGRAKEIIVRFEDHDQLYIDGVSINDDLLNSIDNLAPGIELSMIIHPNSNTIMELHADNQRLLDFQNTAEKLNDEATGFMGLGLFCYVLSACGLINLVFRKKR